jgi:6-pyruvoyltetrahydropterin/6-carboxytetrahydropterin synthase
MTDQLLYLAAARFEAARQVSILPHGHRSRYLHGHSFLARVRAKESAFKSSFPGAEVDTLGELLAHVVSPLNYSYLNEHLDVPTDENLARWVHSKLDSGSIEQFGIQSTLDQGVDLDENGHAHIWRKFRFEAAHQLPNVPEGHKCGRMHGHGFEVILHVNQHLADSDAMGMDFDQLKAHWQPLHEELHHACLNDMPGLENPTSEVIAAWIWQRLEPEIPGLSWVTVYETVTAGCHYDGTHHRIWKEQRFESALQFPSAPENDSRKNLHGHSYLQRLHLTAPLDDVMGWTIDYGDVKELFKPTYAAIDHHLLNSLPELGEPTIANLLQWIRNQAAPSLPQLNRIDLFQTPGCGAMLSWGELGPALPA